jgi:hypothetical protein
LETNTALSNDETKEDGKTPYIGENGNWWIGNRDTGIQAGDEDTISITGDFQFGVNSDGNSYYLYKYIGLDKYVKIPEIFNGFPVTSVGIESFTRNTYIETVVIPKTVLKIDNGLLQKSAFFGCQNLENVLFEGDNIKLIGAYAFYSCASLKTIVLPDSVTSIGERAFYNCGSLKNIILPIGIETIPTYTFSNCTSLETIILPNSITGIGTGAFSSCRKLSRIYIPISVVIMGSMVFSDCQILSIYCGASSKPSGWSEGWNSNRPVVWNSPN